MNETRQLVRFAVGTSFEDLPGDVIEYAKVCVLDNLAAGLVGSVQPWSNMVAEMVREAGCTEECTVLGQKWRSNPSGAALVNGVMIGAFESEHALAVGAHPSGNVFPAVMAMAEREHKDGKSFLAAMILGYEVTCRLAETMTRAAEDERGFHGPAINGPFGSAIAIGKLLGFDESTLTNAMGIAGSHSAGLLEFVWEGAMTKRLHLGRGCQMGLESALLARKGFTGPSTILEGKHGFFNVFSPAPQPGLLLADIGKVWHMNNIFIKPFSCHGTQQAVVQALLEFKRHHQTSAKDIRSVTVAGSRSMMHKHDDQEPRSIMGAQYSMPFVVAITLLRDIADPYVLNEETLWNKDVRELAKRVAAVIDPRFDGPPYPPNAEITIELGSGRHIIDASGFKGLSPTPFNFDDVCDKFRRNAVPIIGTKQAEDTIDRVRSLERLPDMAELARLTGT